MVSTFYSASFGTDQMVNDEPTEAKNVFCGKIEKSSAERRNPVQ
jgi:hypothetical protein